MSVQTNWINIRLAIGSALLIGYFITSLIHWYVLFQKNPKCIRIINDLISKMYLFGIGCLLSLNFYQCGLFQVVMAYLNMLTFIILGGTSLLPESVDEKKRIGGYIMLYIFMFAWYLGIVIDYFLIVSYFT